jgi:DNA repair photolyase
MGCAGYGSPRWTGEIADCSMPMTFDTYSNCSFKCIYCFSQYQRGLGKSGEKYAGQNVSHVDVEKIKRMFREPDTSQFGEYIKRRMVMQWGGLSDQFDWRERRSGITLQLLRFFREIDYPICFSTKGTWWLDDARYTDLFRGNRKWNCKFSIITMDETKARAVEVGCPTPEERLSAIGKYAALGAGGATLRLRPFIIGISNPSHVELIRRAGEAGATAVSTEFFCLEQRSPTLKTKLHILDEACGFSVEEFYRKSSTGSGYLRLSRNVKRKFVFEMRDACAQAGMRFYVSDSHFKELSANGCCCGLGEEWNYSRGQFTQALLLAKHNGRVSWGEIEPEMAHLKGIEFKRAARFNSNSSERRASFMRHSMIDYMRWLWNNPSSGQSPYRLFRGAMVPIEKDGNGNLVYRFGAEHAK